MYNYRTYCKEQELQRKFDQIRKEHNRTALHRQKSNPTLAHSHKKRVQGFILSMIDKPVKVVQYSNHPHAFRVEDPTKNIAANAFYLKHQSQAQRLKQSIQINSELDQVPFRNTSTHQFRNMDKDLKSMKYKPVNHNFRIKEFLDHQSLNYLPNTNNQKVDRLIHQSEPRNKGEMDKINKTITKSLLPLLHAKTYFKSVETLFAQLPKQRNACEWQPSTQDSYEQNQIEVKRQNKKSNDHLSRKENSREALLKCNMLHSKEVAASSLNFSAHSGVIRA